MIKKYTKIGVVILVGLFAVSTYTLYNRNQDFARGCLAIDAGIGFRYWTLELLSVINNINLCVK